MPAAMTTSPSEARAPISPALPSPASATTISAAGDTVLRILLAISFCHFLNDTIQSLIPALYPMLKTSFSLDFTQIGFITLAFQLTASLLQPVVGLYTDRHPQPYSLAIGMGFSLAGLLLLANAPSFSALIVAASLVGMGSSIFHPESSRVARMASGGRHGFAQSLFQVGGNIGSSIGPLLAAFVILPRGQRSIAWFAVVPLLAMILLGRVGAWYQAHRRANVHKKAPPAQAVSGLSRRRVVASIAILLVLVFSKYFYLASLNNYYTFYLIHHFHASVRTAQIDLFVFLGSVAAGTFIGGPVGDRVGRKYVIWGSILGVFPFTFALPYASQFWTVALTIPIGLILASAFSAIIVYAQELIPGKVGTVAGLFFGFSFGMGGIGAALLGVLADGTSIEFVYRLCAFLPLLGIFAVFLPDMGASVVRKSKA